MASRDNFNRYLKQMGITTPYDMTEAQQEAQDASNPMGRYGFMSAQDKARQQQIRDAYDAQLAAEQRQMEQAMLARMSSQQQIGYHGGGAVAGGLESLMGMLKNRGAVKDIPEGGGASADSKGMMRQAAPQDDPALTRFNQLVSEGMTPDVAKEMVGKEQGNAAMIQDALREREERQRESLEMDDIKGRIADRQNQTNKTIQVQRTGPDGKPMLASLEIVGRDKDGRNIYKELGESIKGQVTDTNEGWGNTNTGRDKRAGDFENSLRQTANAFDAIDRMKSEVAKNPNITGWAGRLVAKADDIKNGIEGLANLMGTGPEDYADLKNYDFSKFEKVAQGSDKLKAMVIELAAARASALEPGGRFTEGDIQRQIDAIGGNISNPKTFLALLDQSQEMMLGNLENQGRYTKIDGEPVGSKYTKDIESLRSRMPKKAGGAKVRLFRNGQAYDIPEEKVEDALSKGFSRE